MTPEATFESLRSRIAARPELVDEVDAIFRFDVGGDQGGSWIVDLKNPPGSVIDVQATEPAASHDSSQTPTADPPPDCTITVGQEDFVGIMGGQVDPQRAFMMGKIRVAGNFMLATRLRALI